MKKTGRLIIFSAPSGAGKSTIISHLRQEMPQLGFSVSATNRPPRQGEVNGRHYHFLSTEEFTLRLQQGDFLEHEEVYPGCFYGTLKQPIDQALMQGESLILDIDVVGGCRVKEMYGQQALSIFIAPPSIQVLEQRLRQRGTETPETLAHRIGKAEAELTYAPRFDVVVVNDNLEETCRQVCQQVKQFITTAEQSHR